MPGRRVLWDGLAGLWLLDGLLQAQPAMWTHRFVTDILQPAAQDQPSWLAAIMQFSVRIWQQHMLAANAASVLVQLALGVLLLTPRLLQHEQAWARAGLWLSLTWALLVWVFGEGCGGIFTGTATVLTGAPGSALCYAGGALLLLIPERYWRSGQVWHWTFRILGLFWLGAALAQALPGAGYWSSKGLGALFRAAAGTPQPAALALPIQQMATLATAHPLFCNGVFVAVMALLGLAYLSGRRGPVLYGATALWLLFVWWLGQDFGALFSGMATDPNTAPLLGLLALVGLGQPPTRHRMLGSSVRGRMAADISKFTDGGESRQPA